MAFHIRKWYLQVEDTLANESGMPADGVPLRKIVIAAAIRNPHAGKAVQDLSDIVAASKELGIEFGRRIIAAAADGEKVQSYGKACVVGTAGEYEHGNAFLTTAFADPVRDAVRGGKAWVPSTGKRGAPGTAIDIPLAHKDALYVRSHYDTVTVTFGDAPAPDEVVVIYAFATRGRLHARLGGLAAKDIQGKDGLR
jgi:Amino acid synthesis